MCIAQEGIIFVSISNFKITDLHKKEENRTLTIKTKVKPLYLYVAYLKDNTITEGLHKLPTIIHRLPKSKNSDKYLTKYSANKYLRIW